MAGRGRCAPLWLWEVARALFSAWRSALPCAMARARDARLLINGRAARSHWAWPSLADHRNLRVPPEKRLKLDHIHCGALLEFRLQLARLGASSWPLQYVSISPFSALYSGCSVWWTNRVRLWKCLSRVPSRMIVEIPPICAASDASNRAHPARGMQCAVR